MQVYTSTSINDYGIGGWCFLISYSDGITTTWGNSLTHCSKNEIDLICVYKAFEKLQDNNGDVAIHTSSSFVYNGLNHCKEWNDNNWLSKNGKSIKYCDLWKLIFDHSTHINLILSEDKNLMCDTIATKAANDEVTTFLED